MLDARFSHIFAKAAQRGLSAIAEHLVDFRYVAVVRNESDSKATGVEAKFRTYNVMEE